MEILIGADPEAFIRQGNRYISAHGIVPGDKKTPHKVDKGAVQVDGFAFEYNIDPAKTPEEFDENHRVVQAQMIEMLKKHDKSLELVFVPYVQFEIKYFKEQPAESKILGCEVDYNYQGTPKAINESLANSSMRTAAGHIHLGWTKDEDPTSPIHFEDARFIANHFYIKDNGHAGRFLGYNMTYEEQVRLSYYGGLGAFRPKTYGVELRGYSNLWCRTSDHRQKMFRYFHSELSKLGG